jgi:hypothetical protein
MVARLYLGFLTWDVFPFQHTCMLPFGLLPRLLGAKLLLVGTRSADHIRATSHSGCIAMEVTPPFENRPDTLLHPNASQNVRFLLTARAVHTRPIASDIALEPHVGFRGTPDIGPSGAPSVSVANDPKRTLVPVDNLAETSTLPKCDAHWCCRLWRGTHTHTHTHTQSRAG